MRHWTNVQGMAEALDETHRDGGRESKSQLNSLVRVVSTRQNISTSRYLEQHVVGCTG
jgi:hypothetical protein